MSSNSIPSWARRLVQTRDRFRCIRCGGAGSNWHHRRSKSVHDDHRHCPCNGIMLCGSGTTGCHHWAHNHPLMARMANSGLIVSRHVTEPFMVPVMSVVHGGMILLDCEGGWVALDERTMEGSVQ